MKKRRIVLASVLKPVNDTRLWEKLGHSLATKSNFEVHIIGFESSIPDHPSVQFHVLNKFSRMSFQRFLAPLKVFKILYQVKPEILIVSTHELLIVSVVNRILFGARILYDVQENYSRNILYSGSFTGPIKYLLAVYVRIKEWVMSPFINHFILAETGYEKELGFIQKRFTVVENKSLLPCPEKRLKGHGLNLLFTGTLSESTGVFRAISLAKKLYTKNPSVSLTIIGYAAQIQVYKRIVREIQGANFITLIGGDDLVPHDQIAAAISKADFGIVAYILNPSNHHSIPTKLYEYLSQQLPMIIPDHRPWTTLCTMYSAAIPINFENVDGDLLLQKMQTESFYTTTPQNVFWFDEEPKFLQLYEKLISNGNPH